VIELKVEISDNDERATLIIVDAGKALAGTFKLVYANEERSMHGSEIVIPSYRQLRNILVEFSAVSSKEMKVWIHRVTSEGSSDAIPATLRIKGAEADQALHLDSRSGQVIVPLNAQTNSLEITL
jgi:hypothetical protein